MDPELREYMEQRFTATEQRVATKADLEGMATEAGLGAVKIEMEAMRDDIAALKHGQAGLRQGQAAIIQRIDAGFAARKQDEDLALGEIEWRKARVVTLEKRK